MSKDITSSLGNVKNGKAHLLTFGCDESHLRIMRQIDESVAEKDFDGLLDQVERGEVFVILRKGKSIARLEPYGEANESPEQKSERL